MRQCASRPTRARANTHMLTNVYMPLWADHSKQGMVASASQLWYVFRLITSLPEQFMRNNEAAWQTTAHPTAVLASQTFHFLAQIAISVCIPVVSRLDGQKVSAIPSAFSMISSPLGLEMGRFASLACDLLCAKLRHNLSNNSAVITIRHGHKSRFHHCS